MTISLASLISQETKQEIYDKALDIARTIGLPVTSWQPGDPTRSLYWHLSEVMSTVEAVLVGYVASGFLDYAAADDSRYQWLVLLAEQVYGYTAREATYATTTVTLTNTAGGLYVIESGDLTFEDSSTGKTFHSTSGGTLASGPGTTLDVDVVADESGSASSASAHGIDTLVTTLLGVTVDNATAAIGIDEESSSDIAAGCRAKLAALSPNGPGDAYVYVATNATLTGTTGVTLAIATENSTTGNVVVYLAGPNGHVSGADVTAANTAMLLWARPLCVTLTTTSASDVVVPVTYSLRIYDSVSTTDAAIEAAIANELAEMFVARPIGGDDGKLAKRLVESTIMRTFPDHAFDVTVSAPAADVALSANAVAVLGAITPTITQEPTP